jgi:dihydrodipicolinate synthase/N-acetylneuraminate lyase
LIIQAAAQAAQEKVSKIRELIKQFPSHGAVKFALSLLGQPLSFVRPPLVDLSTDQKRDLEKETFEDLAKKNK